MRRSITMSPIIGFLIVLASTSQLVVAQETNDLPSEVVRFADSVYVNAKIVTIDDHEMNDNPGTIVSGMAVRDGVIIGLGSDDEVLRMAGPDTEIVDLAGKMVLPGIVESHVHPMRYAESLAREEFKLRNTPEGYSLQMSVGDSADDTMVRVARAMDILLANAEPSQDEWINIELLHDPELGFATPADVSTLMSAPQLADVSISKSDITEMVPDYPFVLSSATSIMDAPEEGIWYHVTAGPDGEPVYEQVVVFEEVASE